MSNGFLIHCIVATMTFAGSTVTAILVARRSRFAPLSAMATGLISLYLFVTLPVFMPSGAVVSLLAIELGFILYLVRIPRRVRPPAYYLSESGVGRLHHPVEYLSNSGVWRERPVNRRRFSPRFKLTE